MLSLKITSVLSLLFILKSASAQCSGTGPGTCNLGVQQPDTGDNPVASITIYDSGCNVLGFLPQVQAGESIDSQLPYTVDITSLNFPDMEFQYAGTTYTDFACGDDDGDLSCQAAFNC